MRVSGRKLRLAVGTGFAALMLMVGVSSVGATAPGAATGNEPIVVGAGVSAADTNNPTVTVANYRDAPAASNATGGGTEDGCRYLEIGRRSDGQTIVSVDIDKCGAQTLRPAAYPLWEVVTGTSKSLVVPETAVPRNGTLPAKTYIIETFR